MSITSEHSLSSSFAINSIVCGYHIYKNIWTSVHGEELHYHVTVVTCMICMLFPLCDKEALSSILVKYSNSTIFSLPRILEIHLITLKI